MSASDRAVESPVALLIPMPTPSTAWILAEDIRGNHSTRAPRDVGDVRLSGAPLGVPCRAAAVNAPEATLRLREHPREIGRSDAEGLAITPLCDLVDC